MIQTVRDQIRSALAAALAAAQEAGALPRIPATEISVERPSRPEHGDYATSVALRMAGIVGRKPLDVAETIASRIERGTMIEAVDVAAPGFINLRLTTAWKTAPSPLPQSSLTILPLGWPTISSWLKEGPSRSTMSTGPRQGETQATTA